MTVKRIVPNFKLSDPDKARYFYENILGLEVIMDLGWILTFVSDQDTRPQVSIAAEGGADAEVPDLSIEVDDVDQVYRKAMAAKCEIVREIADEEWGVRRFFVRDPSGHILNILAHRPE